jgi:(5-formylfuran-3-yl)methyl phosphate synthase
MQLLVSVRSAAEVEPALAGGADIIDAKDPGRGPLGAVALALLRPLLAQVPPDRPVSVALGDVSEPGEVIASIASLPLSPRPAPIYLKLGFAGVRCSDRIAGMIAAAVRAASSSVASPRIVAVAYADAARAGTIPPALLARVTKSSGAAGVLLDTFAKDGAGLRQWIDSVGLADWVAAARDAGLVTAVAGSVGLPDLRFVREAAPDVLGVRGAACEGGRLGRVTRDRVRALRAGLDQPDPETARWAFSLSLEDPGRETREAGANSVR